MAIRTRAARTTVALASLAVAGGLLTTAPAGAIEPATVSLGAAEDLRYKKSTVTVPGDFNSHTTYATASPICDQDWQTVSGGQQIGAKSRLRVNNSLPGEDDTFFASAWQQYDVESSLTAFAVCLKTTKLAQSMAQQLDVPGNSQVTGAAYCGNGYAVGGGVLGMGEADDFSLNASYPVDGAADVDTVPDDGWRGYVHYSGTGGGGVRFLASCLDGPSPAYRSKAVNVPAGSAVGAQALCPRNRPVVGGGVYVTGAASRSHVIASRPWDGGDSGSVPEDGWRGGVSNTSDGPLTMTVHAICR